MSKMLEFTIEPVYGSALGTHAKWRATTSGVFAYGPTKAEAQIALRDAIERHLRARNTEPIVVATSAATYVATCDGMDPDGLGDWTVRRLTPGHHQPRDIGTTLSSAQTRAQVEQWMREWAWQQSAELALINGLRGILGYRQWLCEHCGAAMEGWLQDGELACRLCGRKTRLS